MADSSEESIFYSAVQLNDPEARAAFVADACGESVGLRQRVEELLSAYGDGEFLESPATDLAATALLRPIGEKPGDVIGPYKLLEQIGEGGMGLVFMAEQSAPLRRRVALKIIKPGLDTRAVIARFDAERQALALMDHPNIARVYDAGATDSGRPFFVMELVRGAPITDYCHERNLSLRERLTLFIEVCQAVQHAHQKGIIHRDLKPTNILVSQSDTAPVPKVIDFGVAKATIQPLTERTLFTSFAQIIGTPLYMSPEQADLGNQDVDTRGDVYSLGVVLYELLTGTTPFDAERFRSVSHDEMRRIIREEDPPKPSTRATTVAAATTAVAPASDRRQVSATALKGDLDWIVMKALDKDRRRRYESPSALAADLERHLANEPVEAHPPTGGYRIARLIKRHRVALLTASVVVAALVAGLATSVWQAVRATNAEHATAVALQQARRAVDDMYTAVAEKWLADQGALTAVQRELLEKALEFYSALSAQAGASPEVQAEAMRARLRVARIHRRLGNSAEAENACREAITECTRLVAAHPEQYAFRLELVNALTELATILIDKGHGGDSREQADLIRPHLAELSKADFPSAELRRRFAETLTSLAGMLRMANRREQANEAIELALRLWQGLVEEFPTNFDDRYGLARAKVRLGTQHMWWGSTDDSAERVLREADGLLSELLAERPDDASCRRTLSGALTNLGVVFAWKGRLPEAIEVERRNLPLQEALARQFPDHEIEQESYRTSLVNLASALIDSQLGEPGEVLSLHTKAHEIAEALIARFPTTFRHKESYVVSLIDVCRSLYEQGRRDEILGLMRESQPQFVKVLESPGNEPNASLAGEYLSCGAAVHVDFGDYAAAIDLLRRYPLDRFHANLGNPLQVGTQEYEAERVSHYEAQAFLLLQPAALFDACAQLAKRDANLSAAQQTTTADSCLARGLALRQEGQRAIDAWVDALAYADDTSGIRVGFHGEKRIESMLKAQDDSRVPPCLRNARATTNKLMFQKLVKEAAGSLAKEPSQYYVAELIAAAPRELRDDKLALKFARRAVQLAPSDEHAQQALGWALYRVDEWQSCVDVLGDAAYGTADGPQSVLTMALWQLGRRDEARRLFNGAEERLEHVEKEYNERDARGVVTLPSLSMLQRLHREAAAMLTPGADADNRDSGG